jgi:hypothetical protein
MENAIMNSREWIRRALLPTVVWLLVSQMATADAQRSMDAPIVSTAAYDPSQIEADGAVVERIIPLTLDIGTLMVAARSNRCIGGPSVLYGFASGIGSYSPTGLTGGNTVSEVADVTPSGACVAEHSDLDVTGFSSNPGSSWLNSITCNGVKNLGSGATFVYSSGDARWEWSQLFGLSSKVGSNVSCTIDHN